MSQVVPGYASLGGWKCWKRFHETINLSPETRIGLRQIATNGLSRAVALCACRSSVFNRQDWTGRPIHRGILRSLKHSKNHANCEQRVVYSRLKTACRKTLLVFVPAVDISPLNGDAISLNGALPLGHWATGPPRSFMAKAPCAVPPLVAACAACHALASSD